METLIDLFTQVAERWGLLIVFVVTFAETSAMLGLVVPGETTVLLAGALASQGIMDIRALIVVVCLAGLLGDNVGYVLGRRLGRDFLLRHGRYVRLREGHLDRTEAYFASHGGSTILFGRWIGFIRSLLPFVAGSARMFYPRFAVYDFFGTVSWGVASCLLGYLFGASYSLVDEWLGRLSLFVFATIAVGVLLWLFGRYLSRHRAALEGLTGRLTDSVLEWRPVRVVRHRYARQLDWLFGRFSPRRVYGLGLTVGLLVTLAFGWLFGLITGAILGSDSLTGFDAWVSEFVVDSRVPWLTQTMKVVTAFGSGWFLVPMVLVVGGILLWRRHRWDALALVTATGGAVILARLLQELVMRPRPLVPPPLVVETSYSFPSVHTTGAAAFYGTLAVLATGWVRGWEARVYLLVGALAATLLVGFSRVYLGVHFASDVLAGMALGAGWLTLSVTAATVLARAQEARAAQDPPAAGGSAGSDAGRTGLGPTATSEGLGRGSGRAPVGKVFSPHKASVLDDEARLDSLSVETLLRLLDLRGGEDIADLGSGTGFYAERLAAHTTGTVYAVELQPEMQRLHAVKPMRPNVKLVLAHLDDVPLGPGSIDRAISVNTFHEAHGPRGLERLAQALRPGGRLVVVDWRKAPEAADRGPRLEHRLSADEMEAVLAPWFSTRVVEELNPYLVAVTAVPATPRPGLRSSAAL